MIFIGFYLIIFFLFIQNQIIATQSVYMKQQQQQQPSQHNLGAPSQQGANVNDLFKQQDPVALLQGNFGDLALKDPQMVCTSFNLKL